VVLPDFHFSDYGVLPGPSPTSVYLYRFICAGSTVVVNGGYVEPHFFRAGFLAITCLFAGITPLFFQGNKAEIEQQKSPPGDSIQETVRRNLSEDVDEQEGARNLFLLGDEAVPSLIKFLSDSDKAIRASAARSLAYIGNERGMQALRTAVKAERDTETKSAISCFLAGGLVETESKADLHFLRRSVESERLADDNEKSFWGFCAGLALA
jgi:HEAT repeats